MNRVAILDNTVLATLIDSGNIELLEKSRNIFRYLLIPEKIRDEFLDVEVKFLHRRERFDESISRVDAGFYRLCTTQDEIILGLAQTIDGIDQGEAEAIAQALKQNTFLFITDDKKCIEKISENFSWLNTIGTVTLVSMLDIQELLIDAPAVWRNIYDVFGFKHGQLKEAVRNAFLLLGVSPDKKLISEKSSWKRIFGEPPKKKRGKK